MIVVSVEAGVGGDGASVGPSGAGAFGGACVGLVSCVEFCVGCVFEVFFWRILRILGVCVFCVHFAFILSIRSIAYIMRIMI